MPLAHSTAIALFGEEPNEHQRVFSYALAEGLLNLRVTMQVTMANNAKEQSDLDRMLNNGPLKSFLSNKVTEVLFDGRR